MKVKANFKDFIFQEFQLEFSGGHSKPRIKKVIRKY